MLNQNQKTLLPIIVFSFIALVCFCSKQSTKPADDTTPPVASTIFPAANAAEVPIDTQVFIVFSEAIRADSLDQHLQLLPDLGRKDSVVYDPQAFKLILIPDTMLNYQTTYQCRIAPGITDLAGNPFNDNKLFTWSFTTIRDPNPYLLSVFPMDSSVNVEPDASIELTFNKAMNNEHLLAKFRLLSPNGTVSGQLAYHDNDFRLSFDPDSLQYRTTYTIELAEGIESADGYVFNNGQRYQSIFTVRAPDQIQVLDYFPRET
ncbi:MAG TPA: Ig-like domain-containing protein, partial [bacterium]